MEEKNIKETENNKETVLQEKPEEPQIVLKRFLEYIILLPYVFGKSRGTCPLKDRTK